MSKLIYLSKSTIPSRTANSVHVMKMCQALANENHEVILYSYNGGNDADIYKFYGVNESFNIERTKRISNSIIQPLFHLFKVTRHINSNIRPDMIYSRDLLTLFILQGKGIPFAYEAHSFSKNNINIILEKRIFMSKNFKFLGVISRALKEEYLSKYPKILKGKILVIPDGADLPLKPKDIKDKDMTMKEFNVNRPQIGYVGHLYKGRGIDIVLETSKKLPNYDFHIIGGEEKDIQYWSNRIGNQKNLFFHGFVPNYKLFKYYEKIDILLAPYQKAVSIGNGKTDTSKWMSPMKIFEYMSYKKCVISSDIEVLKEVLIDRYNALLVDPTSIDDWVNTIVEAVNDVDLYKRVSNNAYNDLVNKYTWAKRAKTILKQFSY